MNQALRSENVAQLRSCSQAPLGGNSQDVQTQIRKEPPKWENIIKAATLD